jgi:hypothetical protein
MSSPITNDHSPSWSIKKKVPGGAELMAHSGGRAAVWEPERFGGFQADPLVWSFQVHKKHL